MSNTPKPHLPTLSVFRNWISLLGLLLSLGSVVAFVCLIALEFVTGGSNPYIGIIAFLIIPMFLGMGLAGIALGLFLERRRLVKGSSGQVPPLLILDFSQPNVRRNLFVTGLVGTLILIFGTLMMYQGYHFTESPQFCGQVCHTVMKPEYTTYQHSPHARLSCAECHIGSGASWYVKSKLSGLRQVVATTLNTYSRPIETPVKNLRPAQDTCEQCHWPSKFVGNLDRSYTHFLADASNTPFTIRLLLKVGGADSKQGPVGGIHWHMNVGNKVEYIASDALRQKIPWVRITNRQGVVHEYQTPGFKRDSAKDVVIRMDCMDCHNRPSHIFHSPADAVDVALANGSLDRTLPSIKKSAIETLTAAYSNTEDGVSRIASQLQSRYPNDPRATAAVDTLQAIFRDNFFPEMKTDWKTHPNNLGHKDFPGCFRCHDGEHKTADGTEAIKANDCNTCHTILAQGQGAELDNLNAKGHAFAHPGGELDPSAKCNDCHTGALQ